MSKTLRSALAFVLVASSSVRGAQGAPTTILSGTYTWEQGKETGALTATFAPLEPGRWRVVFRVGGPEGGHFYSGEAEGKIGEGSLQGRVERDDDMANGTVLPFIGDLANPGQEPTGAEVEEDVFTFKGEFKDGRFLGTHASVVDGKEERTGTLTLSNGP